METWAESAEVGQLPTTASSMGCSPFLLHAAVVPALGVRFWKAALILPDGLGNESWGRKVEPGDQSRGEKLLEQWALGHIPAARLLQTINKSSVKKISNK